MHHHNTHTHTAYGQGTMVLVLHFALRKASYEKRKGIYLLNGKRENACNVKEIRRDFCIINLVRKVARWILVMQESVKG